MTQKNVTVKVGRDIRNYGIIIIYKIVKIYELAKNYKAIESYKVIRNDRLRKTGKVVES
ncbi:MAG: hypothetical protein E6Z55_03865 [Peptoniphilus harei]|nr:hypothetical protein [Peptoniphilus harei]